MNCCHYFIFFCFFNCQILQLNAFDEEHNDIFGELAQKSEDIGTKSGKCEETLQTNSIDDLISQKIGKIKKEIVVKDEPNDYAEFDQFSNESQQKIALNTTVKEENVEKRVKSEFMEFDRISNKEEFDNGKDGEEQSTDSDNSNLKENSSKSQKDNSEIEKKEIIAEFYKLKKEFKTMAKGMSYHMKKIEEKIAKKLGVSRSKIYIWKKQLGISKNRKNYTDTEKVELLKNFNKIKKENPQLCNDEIAQMLNIHSTTLMRWERKSKGLEPGIKKIYSEAEKQEIIAEFYKLKKEFKIRAKGMSYDMKKVNEQIAQKLGFALRTIYKWKTEFGAPGIRKIYSEVEKQEIIAEFDQLKKEFKTRANGMSYSMNKIDGKIARKLGVSRKTIYFWKKQFGVPKKRKNYTDTEKVELLKNFNKIKKENPQLCKDKIAQMLNIHSATLIRWEKEFKAY